MPEMGRRRDREAGGEGRGEARDKGMLGGWQ